MAGLPPPPERQILHFTHVSHLASVIAQGGLLADALVGDALTTEVGDRQIKAARRTLTVSCGPGGHPCDYVPFYFAPRSPMLYRIAKGGVEQYHDGQDPLVYLASRIEDVDGAERPWVFSDGNCGSMLTRYYDDLDRLDDAVDWPLQEAKWWNSTAEDPNRATRRAAEFLVHQTMPWELVRGLVVRTDATRSLVQSILDESGAEKRIVVRPHWYYEGPGYL